jgi:hypothetical protein
MWCSAGAGVRTVPETQQAREDKKEREGRERERRQKTAEWINTTLD